jgi:hypothetical protein
MNYRLKNGLIVQPIFEEEGQIVGRFRENGFWFIASWGMHGICNEIGTIYIKTIPDTRRSHSIHVDSNYNIKEIEK